MKAVRLIEPGRPVEMQQVPVPPVGSRDVLVRVQAAGICHSDVHYRAGVAPLRQVRRRGILQFPRDASVTQARWISVANRGLGTATHSLQLFAMGLLYETVHEGAVEYGIDVEFRWVDIPADAPKNTGKSMFDREWMVALEELGREMGADPSSWKSEVPSIYALD